MLQYSMIIQWNDEDNVYTVTIPELPGYRAYGGTYEEAAKNGREVLESLAEVSAQDPELEAHPNEKEQQEDFYSQLTQHIADIVEGEGYSAFCKEWFKTHSGSLTGCYETWNAKLYKPKEITP